MPELTSTITAPITDAPAATVTETIEKAVAKIDSAKAAAEAPKEESKTDSKEQASQRFASLAKKEKAIVKRDLDLKAREQSLVEREKKIGEGSDRFEKLKAEAPMNPLAALESLGITYQQITDFILNQKKPSAELVAAEAARKATREELDKASKAREDESKKLAEDAAADAKKNHERIITEFRSEVAQFVKANADTYELINLYDQAEVVSATIEQHFEATRDAGDPKVMSYKEGCDLVEKYLEEQVDKAKTTKKLQAKADPQPKVESKSPLNAKPRTLTNQLTPSAPAHPRPLSREERIERARQVGKNP